MGIFGIKWIKKKKNVDNAATERIKSEIKFNENFLALEEIALKASIATQNLTGVELHEKRIREIRNEISNLREKLA